LDHEIDVTPGKLLFVFNRVTNRLSYDIFVKQIETEFVRNIPSVTSNILETVFARGQFATRSFSEYPFFVRIVPEAMISKKILLLAKSLFSDISLIIAHVPQWKSLRRRRVEVRINRYVGSPDDDRSQAVFGGFGLAQLTMFLITIPVWVALGRQPNFWEIVGIAIFTVIVCSLLIYIFWLDLKVAAFYRTRSDYERRTRVLLNREVDLSYYLQVSRLVSLRLLTYLCGVFLLFEVLTSIVLGITSAAGVIK